MRFSFQAGLVCVLVAAGSCGGSSGGGESGGADRTIVLSIDGPDWDGTWQVSSSSAATRTDRLSVGDTATQGQYGYVGFLLGPLPPGATIRSARLRLYQGETTGAPFTKLGDIYVDHIDADSPLDVRHVGGELQELLGMLSDSTAQGWHGVEVTANVRADLLVGRSHSVFRLHFWEPVSGIRDGVEDGVSFEDSENSNGGEFHPPELVVTYTP